jgi:hypothetical protein
MNIVLFLGAGFSRPFGLPTMNEFFSTAYDSDRIEEKDKLLLQRLVLEARSANSILESRPTNLEDILSFAVMRERLDLEQHPTDESERIKRIVRHIYTADSLSKPDGVGNPHRRFFEQFDNKLVPFLGRETDEGSATITSLGNSLSIITTNYDLVAECTLYSMGLKSTLEFDCDGPQDKTPWIGIYDKHGIPIHKLHGSVNWFEPPDIKDVVKPKLVVDGRVVQIGNITEYTDKPASYARDDDDGYDNPGVPFIIPPTFLKPDFRDELQKVWSGAAKTLSDAEVVVFVGYSFPPTDVEMRYFLAASLVKNARLRKILIVDRDASDIVRRLKSAESGFGAYFCAFLEPHDGSWIDQHLGLLQPD